MKFAILALAFVLAVVAVVASSPVVAQDVIYRPAKASPIGIMQAESVSWDAILALEARVKELERKLARCKCVERSVLAKGRRARVWSVVQTPSNGSCRYCEPFKGDIKAAMVPMGWVFSDDGDVRFESVEDDGDVFPRTIIFRDGKEVQRILGAVTPLVLTTAINRHINETK